MPDKSAKWRTGARVPLNVYAGDRPICQCHNEEDARRIVEAVNWYEDLLADLRTAVGLINKRALAHCEDDRAAVAAIERKWNGDGNQQSVEKIAELKKDLRTVTSAVEEFIDHPAMGEDELLKVSRAVAAKLEEGSVG